MKKSIEQILGENIRRERVALELSQVELGEAVGVTGQTVYRWESGTTWPTARNIEDMAKHFGIPSWRLYMPLKKGAT